MSGDNHIQLYIVGKINPENYKEWEFAGIYSDYEQAMVACKDKNYFVGSVILDERLSPGLNLWPGAKYPKHKLDTPDPRLDQVVRKT